MMRIYKLIAPLLIAGFLIGGIASCSREEPSGQEGAAEQAGEKVDKAVEQAGEKIEQAGDKVEQKTDQ